MERSRGWRGSLFMGRMGKRRQDCLRSPRVVSSASGEAAFVQFDDARGRSMGEVEMMANNRSSSTFGSSVDDSYRYVHEYLTVANLVFYEDRSRARGLQRFRWRMHFSRRPETEFYGEQMSYEENLALEEWMGTVSVGVEESVLKELKTKRASGHGSGSCPICLCEFEKDERLRELKCSHDFHLACIDTWFQEKNSCPVCKAGVA